MVDGEKKQNKYVQTSQIGKGSFGSAFLVRNKEDGKQYVLKKVRLARQSNYQKNQNFQEVELLKSLRHPCLVPYIEHWVKEGHTICVVYGYCQNGDVLSNLQRKQKKGEKVEEATAKLWLAQLLLGLWYLRQHSVLHRDIKTANLLLTSDNNLQIGDFGFATFRTGGDDEDYGIIGTPHYMAPEMLMRKKYGFPVDVWAAGVVAYELACNKPAFQAFNIEGLIQKIQRAGVPQIPTFSEEYSVLVKAQVIGRGRAFQMVA